MQYYDNETFWDTENLNLWEHHDTIALYDDFKLFVKNLWSDINETGEKKWVKSKENIEGSDL